MTFSGFPEEITARVSIPEQFFRQALPSIDNLLELKLILYIFWQLDRMEGPFHYLLISGLLENEEFIQSLTSNPEKARTSLLAALRRAVRHGILLTADLRTKSGRDKIICLNSPRGRAAIAAIQRGEWRLANTPKQPIEIYPLHPNIFQLYEANIGPLTPMIADALRDAEKTYQASWIEDAFRIAVERNKRNWHYIEAILHRWQEGGRDDRKDQPDRFNPEEARRKYREWEK